MELNIIGDIAGRYETLLALLEKMPKSATPLSVGDMVDRGPKSKEVLEFFKNHLAVLGNHEHFMLTEHQAYTKGEASYYQPRVWFANGGIATLKSFIPDLDEERLLWYRGNPNFTYQYNDEETTRKLADGFDYYCELMKAIPQDLINWLAQLPLFYEEEGLFVSHAPRNPTLTLERLCDLNVSIHKIEQTIIWNRGSTRRLPSKIQIHGHNAERDVDFTSDKDGNHTINIDTSFGRKLTGIHWPSLEIFQQDFLEK
jgi:hypothetical protein